MVEPKKLLRGTHPAGFKKANHKDERQNNCHPQISLDVIFLPFLAFSNLIQRPQKEQNAKYGRDRWKIFCEKVNRFHGYSNICAEIENGICLLVKKVSLHFRTDVSEQEPTSHTIVQFARRRSCYPCSITSSDDGAYTSVVAGDGNGNGVDPKICVISTVTAQPTKRNNVKFTLPSSKVNNDISLRGFAVAEPSHNRQVYTGRTATCSEQNNCYSDIKAFHEHLRFFETLTFAFKSRKSFLHVAKGRAGIGLPLCRRCLTAAPFWDAAFMVGRIGAPSGAPLPTGGKANSVSSGHPELAFRVAGVLNTERRRAAQ